MKHNNKSFNQRLHDENDKPAKDAVKRFLKQSSRFDVLEGDQYGVDLLLHDQVKVIATIEVERRQWQKECPFDTIRVPERKGKFFGANCFLFSVSQDCTIALWCRGSQIRKCEIVSVNNRLMGNEPFFNVPKQYWTRVVL